MNPPAALGHLSRLLLSRLDQRARLEVDELVMDSTSIAVAVYVLYTQHTHTHTHTEHRNALSI